MKKLLLIILIISTSLYALLSFVESAAFDYDYYYDSFEKYEISQKTGKSMDELMDIIDDLLNYLKGSKDEGVLETNFNSKEILHMIDVKLLFKYGYILKDVFLVLSIISLCILVFKRKYKDIGRYLVYSFLINIGLIIFLLIMSFIDFNKVFTYFHLILFTNDLWLLDPSKDLLIQMLPQGVFIGLGLKIALSFLVYLAIILLTGLIIKRKVEISD